MGWLLDTHVWIWSQLAPERMGPETTTLLENPEERLLVSTISTLELAQLVSRGRVELTVDVRRWVERSLEALAASTLELSHEIALEAYALPSPFHRDPADRTLVATARLHDLVMVTADERILSFPHLRSHNALR